MIQDECKSLLFKLKLQQKNIKNFLPSKNVADSFVSEASTDESEISIWSSPGQSSYARNKLKTLISSLPKDSGSPQSSFSRDVSIDCPKKQSLKPKFYQNFPATSGNLGSKTCVKELEYESTKSKDSSPVMTPPRTVKVSGSFLHDIHNYLDDSNDLTMTSLNSDYTTLHKKSPTMSDHSSLPSTPNTAQKRSIIDRNVPVSSRYDDFQFDTNASKLNYSYSTVDDDEESFLKSRLNESPEDIFLRYDKDYKMEKRDREHREMEECRKWRSFRNKDLTKERNTRDAEKSGKITRPDTKDKENADLREEEEIRDKIEQRDMREKREKDKLKAQQYEELYKKQLKDSGNDKSHVSVIRDSIQPRSILSSPGSRNSSKSKSSIRVSFKSNSVNDGTMDEVPLTSKFMGYDWIAALLDNESGQVDESESFFQELKEFRRSNRDECCNNFYMNNTLTYAEPKEEPPVVKALTEPKVKPYVVNDRLFTEPLKKRLNNGVTDTEYDDDDEQPSQQHPRYVRVSIPRSTLEKPYKVKPHRRNSFDPTDSCSLREHCLMGWENSRVSALPTASSLDINEATKGLKPKMTTTLAEAELTARTGSTQMWPFVTPPTRVDPLPTWRKQYEASVVNCSQPSLPNSTIPGDSDSLRQSTNSLLNSTYSLMYEMERLKKERESTKA